jgi:hypothetical protein
MISSIALTFNLTVPVTFDVNKLIASVAASISDDHSVSVARLDHANPGIEDLAGTAYQRVAKSNLDQLTNGSFPDAGWGKVEDLSGIVGSFPTPARKVILRAIANGGHVSRAEVYAILGRSEDQSLKGFTRPVNRVMQSFQEKNAIPANAEPLLEPIYDTSVKTYQQAQGFRVPLQVVAGMRASK